MLLAYSWHAHNAFAIFAFVNPVTDHCRGLYKNILSYFGEMFFLFNYTGTHMQTVVISQWENVNRVNIVYIILRLLCICHDHGAVQNVFIIMVVVIVINVTVIPTVMTWYLTILLYFTG